jgi:hypothetical protein
MDFKDFKRRKGASRVSDVIPMIIRACYSSLFNFFWSTLAG